MATAAHREMRWSRRLDEYRAIIVTCCVLLGAYPPHMTETCQCTSLSPPVVTITGDGTITVRVIVSKICCLWKDATQQWVSDVITPRNLGLSGCKLVSITKINSTTFDVVLKPSTTMAVTVYGNSVQDAGGATNKQVRWSR